MDDRSHRCGVDPFRPMRVVKREPPPQSAHSTQQSVVRLNDRSLVPSVASLRRVNAALVKPHAPLTPASKRKIGSPKPRGKAYLNKRLTRVYSAPVVARMWRDSYIA